MRDWTDTVADIFICFGVMSGAVIVAVVWWSLVNMA